MPDASHIHVRSLELADFTFVRDLASKQPNFTVPPSYVLWLLSRVKGAICLVAEQSDLGPVGYLLAGPIEATKESLFVWQLATTENPSREQTSLVLLGSLKDIAATKAVQTIAFSARPRSAAYRLISQYTNKLVANTPRLMFALPSIVALDESEYRIDLG